MKEWKSAVSGFLALAMTAGLLTGAVPPAAAAGDEPEAGDIVILYTNDVHCGVDQKKDTSGSVTNIGYAGVAAYKKAMELQVGEDFVTLVDAGDAMQGDAIGTLSKGEYLADIMNEVGYDIFVPGNHEFDYGMDRMQELMEMLDAEVISCNFTDLQNGGTLYAPYTVETYGDVRVAFVGVTTPESFTKSTPAYFQDEDGNYIYGFCEGDDGQELYTTVQSAVDDARAGGADYVIAVGHLGVDEQSEPWRSADVIANTSGIDAFIDGHSHTVMASQTVANKDGGDVLLTQTGTKLANIGRMVISSGGDITAELISGYDQQDADTLTYIQGIEDEFAADLAQVVGHTDVALTVNDPVTGKRLVRSGETNLGDLCADAYRYVLGNGKTGVEAGPADVAFVNGGGVRANIDAGDITFGEVISVHPFNNVGCVVEATGQEILDALEMGARVAPGENGGFLQVSGLTYTIDLPVPSTVVRDDKGNFVEVSGERRVSDVMIEGEPLAPDKTYTVASHNYMLLDGGDGINMFRDNEVVVQPVILDNQVLISYIQDYLDGAVGEAYADPRGQGRISLSASGFADGEASLALRTAARYSSGIFNADGGVQEIVDYNSVNKTAYSVDGYDGILTAVSYGDLADDGSVASLPGVDIDVEDLVSIDGFTYGDMTSVAVSPDGEYLAAAIQAEDYTQPGRVALFTCNADGSLTFVRAYETGIQPDMVVFAADGTLLTADEGEPREGYGDGIADPRGSVTVIDLETQTSSVKDFAAFDALRDDLTASGVVLKTGAAPSADLEPEYIAVAGGRAYVSLQENNAVAMLDLASGSFEGIYSLGVQDYSMIPADLDNNGGAYTPRYYANTYGLRMPDGIAAYTVGGKTYLLTANEGDSRDWAGGEPGEYLNEDEAKLTSMDGVQTNKKVRMLTGDYDGLPGISGGTHYLFGARSFSLFEAGEDGLTLVYDSGADFERKTAQCLPTYFNCSNDDTAADSRSNKKGPEPENVTVGAVGGRTYAFVGLERIGGVMVYDVTDPRAVSFVNYVNSRDFTDVNADGIGRDDSPEGLKFISANKSPTGGAMLLAAFEVSGDVTAYALTPQTAAEKPVELAIFSDPHLYDAETLGTEGDAFEAYLANDRKMIAESEDILDEALRRILASGADYVLVSGDLTKDGEKVNHELMAEKLALLEQHGKKVFVINGNHDLSNAHALNYSESGTTRVDTVDRAGFAEIYADFGYDEAVARDQNSLSYAVNLGDDYRLIVMDTCIYNNKTDETRSQETGGRLTDSTLVWVLDQIQSAIAAGRRPIGMLHQGLVSHTAVQPVLFPDYLLENYETVAARLADAGMDLVFTGHFHSQDTAAYTASSGSTLYDMETGSLVTYPCPIRYVTLAGNTVAYESEPVDSVPEIPGFSAYAGDYLMSGLADLVPGMLMAVNPALTYDAASAMAETPLAPGLTLAQFLATCMAKHYAGDEKPGTLAPVISALQSYSAGDESTNALYQLLGNASWALANDTTGSLAGTPAPDSCADNTGTLTLSALPAYSNDDGGSSVTSPASGTAAISGGTAVVTGSRDQTTGRVTGAVTSAEMARLLENVRGNTGAAVEIRMSAAASAALILPGASLGDLAGSTSGGLKVDLGLAAVTFDTRSLGAIASAAGTSDVTLSVSAVEASSLPAAVRQAVGDRPVYDFTLTAGGRVLSSFGGSARVSVPYTPAAGEDLGAIVIWYLGDDGTVKAARGAYDSAAGAVVFTADHFSRYAVGYNKVSFSDVADGAWYEDAVTFLAARGITSGTSGTAPVFSPNAQVTRGQFLVMLLRSCGIEPAAKGADNFADAGDSYYTGYLAAARALGISQGVGDNRFAPDAVVSRQEMFTLMYRTLEALDQLPEGASGKALSDFSDAAVLAGYAKAPVEALVKAGVVSGSGDKLDPAGASTRAQMAQLIYNLMR